MKNIIFIILMFFAVAGSFAKPLHKDIDYFDFSTSIDNKDGNTDDPTKAYIRLPKVEKKVKAILYAHQNMTEEVLFRSSSFCSKMDSLGIAMAFIQRGSQNWDLSVKDDMGRNCQQRFEQIISEFATGTGHPEILNAKIIPFGHSAQATFPWNFAAWNQERTLCIISYHGDAPRTNLCGYGRENVEWGRTRNINRIPALMVEGEYEWWEARVNPALAFRMKYPDSRISFLCDAGKGHFDLCLDTQMYIAKFIEKALAYQPHSIIPQGGDPIHDAYANDGVCFSRWYADGSISTDPHDQFWYFDNDMVEWTKRRYNESKGKRMRYVSCKINGKLVSYNANAHVKINETCPGDVFTIEPVFVDETRQKIVTMKGNLRVVLISGPAIEIGENKFMVDRNYFGKDPERQWTGITLCVEADGDSEYKSAVQELNLQAIGIK